MAENDPRDRPSLPFDQLLDDSRESLEALYGKEAAAPPSPRPRQPRTVLPAHESAVQSLDKRFGGRWSHEVIDRLREGYNAVVRCRLTVPDSEIAITRHGRAAIARSDEIIEVAGSAEGIPFGLLVRRKAAPEVDEEALGEAYQRAEAAALESCIAAI